MPTVLDWSPAVDPSELVRAVREALAAGSVAVLPGDCGYVAVVDPAAPRAADHLAALAAGGSDPPAVLAWGPDDPAGLGLAVPPAARRLMFRAWPAPLAVAVPGTPDWPAAWPAGVRAALAAAGPVRFRCPEHPLAEAAVPALDRPALVADTFLPTAEAVLDLVADPDAFAASAGELPAGDRPTVVRADGDGYAIERDGSFAAEEVAKFAARIVLFVCTGNTCRSPLAEGLAKKLLADRLGCGVGDLPRRGVWVLSAGVAAYGGGPAAAEAAAAAAEWGADLSGHRSRPVNPQLLAAADAVVAMTRGHAHALSARYPGVGPAPTLLGGEADLDDPIGAGLDVYRECARAIAGHLQRLLPEWTGP
jgi:protein-tyrosine phosphatase